MNRPDLGRFVRNGAIAAGTMLIPRDAISVMTPDLIQQPPGRVWHSPQDIFSVESQQETHRDKPGHPHRAESHDFERRRAKISTSHFHESRFHPSVRNDGESGFMGGDAGFNSQSTIGTDTIYSSFSEGEHYEPSTAEVGKHGKVLAKFVSQLANETGGWGEGSEEAKKKMQTLAKLEYDFRRLTSATSEQRQDTFATFVELASELPSAPQNWYDELSQQDQRKVQGALEAAAVAGILGTISGLGYEVYKRYGRKKAIGVLLAFEMLVGACGGNVATTATGVLEGTPPVQATSLANPNVRVATGTPGITATAPKDLSVVLGGTGAEGGLFQTCEAEVARLQAQYKLPEGLKIPQDIVVIHGSDPNKWTPAEKAALVDGQGKSIAPTIDVIKSRIEKINPKIRVKAIWSGEGYVLHLTDENGKEVWAVDSNGIPSYRPDMITGTEKFRLIPDPPVDGERRYVVANGCGVLGVFDKKGNMIAVYKPLANKWELFLPPTATVAVPTATSAPVPTSTPDLKNFVPTNFNNCCALNSDFANYQAKEKFDAINTPAFQDRIKKIKANPAYQKPSFNLQPTFDPLGKDILYQYTSYYQMAIYAGGYDVTLPNMDWSIGKGEVKVKMHIYIPVEQPDTPIITIGRITDNIGSGESVLGARFYHKEVQAPSGKMGWGAQVGQEPTSGQMFQIFSATGMGLVDVYNASKNSSQYNKGFIAQGNSLSSHIGMMGAESIAKQIIALPDLNARRALMKTFFDSQKFHLLVQARLYEY